jgi:D-proline reductase (dithiol) PrdB
VSLVARHLEANGIPTVLFGTARDIVEHCSVPRFVFVDFPLGNPCGKPYDVEMQHEILSIGFDLLESATESPTVVQAPHEWGGDTTWKDLIFTEAQPFLEGEALENWNARKQRTREEKAQGGT